MKKRKIKLFASIASLALVVAVMSVGVFAATRQAVNVTSTVQFDATAVEGNIHLRVSSVEYGMSESLNSKTLKSIITKAQYDALTTGESTAYPEKGFYSLQSDGGYAILTKASAITIEAFDALLDAQKAVYEDVYDSVRGGVAQTFVLQKTELSEAEYGTVFSPVPAEPTSSSEPASASYVFYKKWIAKSGENAGYAYSGYSVISASEFVALTPAEQALFLPTDLINHATSKINTTVVEVAGEPQIPEDTPLASTDYLVYTFDKKALKPADGGYNELAEIAVKLADKDEDGFVCIGTKISYTFTINNTSTSVPMFFKVTAGNDGNAPFDVTFSSSNATQPIDSGIQTFSDTAIAATTDGTTVTVTFTVKAPAPETTDLNYEGNAMGYFQLKNGTNNPLVLPTIYISVSSISYSSTPNPSPFVE